MSAAELLLLRRAVEGLRADFGAAPFENAVADWLDYVADQGDRSAINHRARAVAVARAYLGHPS